MIIVKLCGGLGNQMFQYAAAKALALRTNKQLKLALMKLSSCSARDTKREFELNIYNIDDPIATDSDVDKIIGTKYNLRYLVRKLADKVMPFHERVYIKERSFTFDPTVTKLRHNVLLDGYWNSEKYFMDVEHSIRKKFTVRKAPSQKTRDMLNEISKVNAVSIHIRRGDYITNPHANAFHGVCSIEYYKRAIQIISNKIDNPHFFIFSDDLEWVKKNFVSDISVTYVEHNYGSSNHEDMQLMSLCKHNIIANSTFSWWGAWLNQNPNKIVVAPQKWFNDKKLDTRDLLPDSWLKV